ncbi:metallophosphoesterase 1 isoform X3 [Echeneis naucrates]|uniref:metallophosphoesterase 1 isoform X3 n=1 Tax=Echeneis naucrates TaxID=173247 RepID=UPI0011143D10|nr:metallophosphoesterase 1 isoform X3 [Echeneis naucrates]
MDGGRAADSAGRRSLLLLRVSHLLPHHPQVRLAEDQPCTGRRGHRRPADGLGGPRHSAVGHPSPGSRRRTLVRQAEEHWEDDVRRFHRMFRHSTDTELVVLVGNHDIGFHYEMDWFKLQRFEKVFNASSTRIVTKKGVNFLLVNSVALHGDGCPICQSVEKELIKLSRDLNCSLQNSQSGSRVMDSCEGSQLYPPTPPIMLQHYPLFRVSDAGCTGQDAAPPEDRHLLFREKYDVLSKEASQRLLQWFKPRLILSGHTHSGCEVLHDNKYPEISVPSFSWRNRNNPSFILASVSPGSYALSKCFLPEESTVIGVYCSAGACLLLLLLAHCLWMKGLLQCLSLCLLGKHKSL